MDESSQSRSLLHRFGDNKDAAIPTLHQTGQTVRRCPQPTESGGSTSDGDTTGGMRQRQGVRMRGASSAVKAEGHIHSHRLLWKSAANQSHVNLLHLMVLQCVTADRLSTKHLGHCEIEGRSALPSPQQCMQVLVILKLANCEANELRLTPPTTNCRCLRVHHDLTLF